MDLIEKLRTHYDRETMYSLHHQAADEIERLQSGLATHVDRMCALNDEAREADDLRVRLAAILTATANALKGEPKPLQAHSWHDLAEAASQVVAERDALLARIEGAPSVIVSEIAPGMGFIGYTRPEGGFFDDSFDKTPECPLLGKRVALVVIE